MYPYSDCLTSGRARTEECTGARWLRPQLRYSFEPCPDLFYAAAGPARQVPRPAKAASLVPAWQRRRQPECRGSRKAQPGQKQRIQTRIDTIEHGGIGIHGERAFEIKRLSRVKGQTVQS